jgi:hypothetical protein
MITKLDILWSKWSSTFLLHLLCPCARAAAIPLCYLFALIPSVTLVETAASFTIFYRVADIVGALLNSED